MLHGLKIAVSYLDLVGAVLAGLVVIHSLTVRDWGDALMGTLGAVGLLIAFVTLRFGKETTL